MKNFRRTSRLHLQTVATACVMCMAVSASAQDTQATAQATQSTSLDIVPQDVGFYHSSMNHDVQAYAIFNSQAYQNLMESPMFSEMKVAYREGKRKGFDQFQGNPIGEFLEVYNDSVDSMPFRVGMSVIKQLVAKEMFIYGEEDLLAFSEAANKVTTRLSSEVFAEMDGSDEDEVLNKMMAILQTELHDINTPTVVMGSVLEKPEEMRGIILLMDTGIRTLLKDAPRELDNFFSGYEFQEKDDSTMLTFTLTEDMLPWEDIRQGFDHAAQLREILRDKSLAISIGIKGNFFLMSIGPSLEHIDNLGKVPLLIDHPKLARLKESQDKTLTAVSYISEETRSLFDFVSGNVENMDSTIEVGIRQGPDFPERSRMIRDIKSDFEELRKELEGGAARAGTYLSFTHMSDSGLDGYTFDWSENKYLDDSKPLKILQHVGENPTMFAATRERKQERYKFASKWTSRIFTRVREYGKNYAPPQHVATFEEVMSRLSAILETVDQTTDNNLLPAVEDQELAIVLDFDDRKTKWCEVMPESERPLPFPAFAIVSGINDRAKVKQAGKDYVQAARDMIDVFRGIPNSEIPEAIAVPDPNKSTMNNSQMYRWKIPPEAKADESISPYAMLGEDLLILGYYFPQAERLATPHQQSFTKHVTDRENLMSVAYYNNAAMIEAIHLWSLYGLQFAGTQGASLDLSTRADNDRLDFSEAQILETVDRAADLLKCFQTYTSVSYMEEGVQVSRFKMIFKDAPPR